MASSNNIGLYIGAPPGGQSTREVMTGIGTPVMPDGSVQSQVGNTQSYQEPNEIQTGISRDIVNVKGGAGASFGGSPPSDNQRDKVTGDPSGRPVGLDTRYGEGIGFSVVTDGDYMAVGAPYAWEDFDFGLESVILPCSAGQTEQFMLTEMCYGKITLEGTGDLMDLFPGMKETGGYNWGGKTFCFGGGHPMGPREWVIVHHGLASGPPESWGGSTAYVTSYDGGPEGAGSGGTWSMDLYPCSSGADCWGGDGTCTGNENTIGYAEDEAGIEILYWPQTSISTVSNSSVARVQCGAVYVFRKPRGLITDATNATPIVITTDTFDNLSEKVRDHDLMLGNGQISRSKIKIEHVGGNGTANGEYFLKYISETTAELYHDQDLILPVAGGGAFKHGGTWEGAGTDTWIKTGVIAAPFPGGYSERNMFSIAASSVTEQPDPCTGEGGSTNNARLVYSDSRFGWSLDLKDGWILIGEPRGGRPNDGEEWGLSGLELHDNEPRLGSFAFAERPNKFAPVGSIGSSDPKLNEVSGDTSPSGRVYIYHVDRLDLSRSSSREYELNIMHPNPHLNYSGRGGMGGLKGNQGYTNLVPNARIVPEYLYAISEDTENTYNMGFVDAKESSATLLSFDTQFGHSVAFVPTIEGAPIGPDNPVTILVGAPYSRIDKNELRANEGVLTDETDEAPDKIMPEPKGEDGVGGDEWFEGGGSGDGGTRGEAGERAGREDGDGQGPGAPLGGNWDGGGGDEPFETDPDEDEEKPPKERVNRVGHTYAFIGAYPDSGNATYSVWRGVPNLYMGNEVIGSVEYNTSDIKSSDTYTINNLIGVGKVWDADSIPEEGGRPGQYVNVKLIEDTFKWQRLEHRINEHNAEAIEVGAEGDTYGLGRPEMFNGRSTQDRFGWSVGLHGNTAMVGAPRHSWDTTGESYLTDAGAAYVFTRSSPGEYFNTLDPVSLKPLFTKYNATDENIVAISGASALHRRGEYDNFGYSVAVDKSFFAVGAPRHAGDRMGRDFSKGEAGAVFVWKKQPGGTYSFDQKLCHNTESYGLYYGSHKGNTTDPIYVMGSGRDAYSHFGVSLSMCGSNLLIGAPLAGGGLAYDKDALHYKMPTVREKLSTEYEKGGDRPEAPPIAGHIGGVHSQYHFPDNMNIRPTYRGRWLHKSSYKIYPGAGKDYTGSGRTYLFQRQVNREGANTYVDTSVGSDLDDATIDTITESYEDSADTITAGGNSIAANQVYGLMRFSSLGIPRGSQINNAYIDLVSSANDDTSSIIVIHAFDEDDGEMPSAGDDDSPDGGGQEYDNFVTKLETTRTLNRIIWTIPSTKVGQKITTLPISIIIQEIVDRPGWSNNNSIVIIFGSADGPSNRTNTKKSFYSSDYGHRYSPFGDSIPEVDTRPRIHINYSEPRASWKQTHEFSPPKTTQLDMVVPYHLVDLDMGWKDYGRSVGITKDSLVIGCPEYELDMLVGGRDGTTQNPILTGGSGAFVYRDFIGLGCRGNGPPGTPGGNFPHIFSLNTKGHGFLDSEIDLYEGGFAVDSENISLTLPKAHAKFTHAMPLHIGVKYDRGWSSLASKGHGVSSNGMTLAMRDTPSGIISLFLKNFQFTAGPPEFGGDDGLTLHSEGLRPASEIATLFTIGPLPSSGNITLHHRGGHIPVNSPIGDFPEGYPSLYTTGTPALKNATSSLYTSGPLLSSESINITGPYNLPASGKTSLYTRGINADSTTLNLFLEKATGDIDDGIKLYTSGPIVPDGQSISLFTEYDPKCASSDTSSHAIIKFTKQQTILGENVLGTEHGSTGYNMGGLWGWSNHTDKKGNQPPTDLDKYLDGTSWPVDSPKHGYMPLYPHKNNDGIDVDGKTMAVATLGVRYIEKPIGYNYYPDINGLVKIYDWDGDTDTWTLSQTIKHPNDETEIAPKHISFGSSVAIDDTNGILVIGEFQLILAPSGDFRDPNDYGSATSDTSGQAHVYRKINGVWTYEATIDGATILSDGSTPSLNDKKGSNYQVSGQGSPEPWDRFGTYVAIDNGVIIAGAPGQSFGTGLTIQEQVQYSGAVYVFEYNSSLSRWERTQKLVNPDRALHVGQSGSSDRLDATYDGSYFGLICKIKGDTIVVGAPAQTLKLKNGTAQASDGHLIDGAGAVYIFDKSGLHDTIFTGTWSFTKSFHSRGQGSTNEGTVDTSLNYTVGEDYAANFGASLDFYEDNIVVGAPKKKVSDNYLAGESYILEKSGGTWSLKYTLTPTETFSDGSAVHSERDAFGYHVSIMNEDVVLISSPQHDYGIAPSTTADTAGVNTGAIYVFGIQGGNQIRKLVREEAVSNQFFGYNNVAFTQRCDAQIMALTFGVHTSQEGNILDLYQYRSALPLNIRGPLEDNNSISLFTDGVVTIVETMSLFSEGMTPLNTSAGDPGDFPLMLLGPYGITATETLHTKGLSEYQTVFNLSLKASMIGPAEPEGFSDTYSTLSLKMRGPFGASSAGWPYWNETDHRYARRFNINVRSGWHTDDRDTFHIENNYPPYWYNADPPVYERGDPILERGRSYVFDLSDESNAGHTFYLSRINDGGGGHAEGKHEGEFLIGVTGSRASQGGQLYFTVPDDAPDYLYVHCGHHANMGWRIQIINQRASTPQGMPLYINPFPLSANEKIKLVIEGSEHPQWGTRSQTSMNLFAKVKGLTPVSSGINLYTRSVGETTFEVSNYANLYLLSSDIEGEANAATQMNMFMNPQDRVDVTTNMNLSLSTPAYPTGSMTLYLENVQTKKEANIFTEATEEINLFINTTAGIPFGVLPNSAMNLVLPMKGLFGEELANVSSDGASPDVGLDLYIGNNEPTGSIPLFTRSMNTASDNIPLSMISTLGVHSGVSTFMIRGYDDDLPGI